MRSVLVTLVGLLGCAGRDKVSEVPPPARGEATPEAQPEPEVRYRRVDGKWVDVKIGETHLDSSTLTFDATDPHPELPPEDRALLARQQLYYKREALIQDLCNKGIFERTERTGEIPRLWARPAFMLLDFRDKESFASVVYAYYFDEDMTKSLAIYDSRFGKRVGWYAPRRGGLSFD